VPTSTPLPATPPTATSTPAPTPPVISNVRVVVSGTVAVVRWTTDVPATSTVRYGVNGKTDLVVTDPTLTTFHSVQLSGLQRRTTYTYVVESTANGVTSTSAPATFTTR